MITVRRVLPIPISYTLLVLSLLFFPGVANSQDAAVAVPDHAAPTDYGKRWKCNEGFRDAGNSCDPVVVPENAYPTYAMYGTGWKCNRGYRPAKERCIAIDVPENGYLVDASYGVGWKCERGYQAHEEACRSVEVPKNAYLNESGDGWQCARNYTGSRNTCVLRDR